MKKIILILVALGFMGCALNLSKDLSGLWVNNQKGYHFNNGIMIETYINPLLNKIVHKRYSYALDGNIIYLNGSIFAKIEFLTNEELILETHIDRSIIHLFKQNLESL